VKRRSSRSAARELRNAMRLGLRSLAHGKPGVGAFHQMIEAAVGLKSQSQSPALIPLGVPRRFDPGTRQRDRIVGFGPGCRSVGPTPRRTHCRRRTVSYRHSESPRNCTAPRAAMRLKELRTLNRPHPHPSEAFADGFWGTPARAELRASTRKLSFSRPAATMKSVAARIHGWGLRLLRRRVLRA
jgi:hypothetical protein